MWTCQCALVLHGLQDWYILLNSFPVYLGASPAVLICDPLKLDEEESKYVGLAQENGFDLAFFA